MNLIDDYTDPQDTADILHFRGLLEEIEQQRAVREITDAGDTLRYSLKRTRAPVDITCVKGDPVDEHLVRTYRQYYCQDLEQDINECFFWQYSPLLAAAGSIQSHNHYDNGNQIQIHIHILVNEDDDDVYTVSTDAIRYNDVHTLRVKYVLNAMAVHRIATKISQEHGQRPINVLEVSFAI